MDRQAFARAARRRQALEALEFERQREAMLVEQLEDLAAEAEGRAIDEAAFARMDAEDVQLVRATFDAEPGREELFDELDLETVWLEEEPDDSDSSEDEMARLTSEIEASRRRQHSFERYVEALDARGGNGDERRASEA